MAAPEGENFSVTRDFLLPYFRVDDYIARK
jgi:hypothetical protein